MDNWGGGCDSLEARSRVVDAGWGAQVYRVTGLAGLLHSTLKGIQALDQLAIADINPFHHQRKQPPRQTCIAFRLGAVLRAVPIRTK